MYYYYHIYDILFISFLSFKCMIYVPKTRITTPDSITYGGGGGLQSLYVILSRKHKFIFKTYSYYS